MKRLTKSGELTSTAQRGQLLTITVDGESIEAFEGETVAAALLSAGITTFNLKS